MKVLTKYKGEGTYNTSPPQQFRPVSTVDLRVRLESERIHRFFDLSGDEFILDPTF